MVVKEIKITVKHKHIAVEIFSKNTQKSNSAERIVAESIMDCLDEFLSDEDNRKLINNKIKMEG